MMFNRKSLQPDLPAIIEYVKSLERVTFLRDHAKHTDEREGYDRDIDAMQRLLEWLNRLPK